MSRRLAALLILLFTIGCASGPNTPRPGQGYDVVIPSPVGEYRSPNGVVRSRRRS